MEVKQTYRIQCNCTVEYVFHQACVARTDFPVIGRCTKQILVTAVILSQNVRDRWQAAALHARVICLMIENYQKVCQMNIYSTNTF